MTRSKSDNRQENTLKLQRRIEHALQRSGWPDEAMALRERINGSPVTRDQLMWFIRERELPDDTMKILRKLAARSEPNY